jgi:hypothetical protein
VLIAGGEDDAVDLATAELFDPGTGTFRATGPLPIASDSQTATLLADGRVLLAGGRAASSLPTAQLFDPTAGTFKAIGS